MTTALNAVSPLDGLPGNTKPINAFDPLKLATLGSESTLAWFRASELKHSRVAMLATTGYLVQAAGIHFPGMLSHDVSFESLSTMKPLDAWLAVPAAGTLIDLRACLRHSETTLPFAFRAHICVHVFFVSRSIDIRPSSDYFHYLLGRIRCRTGQTSLHQGRTHGDHCFPTG